MDKVLQVASISEFKENYNAIFEKLEDEPVILASYQKAKAVLVSPGMWNDIVRRLQERDELVLKERLTEVERFIEEYDAKIRAREAAALADTTAFTLASGIAQLTNSIVSQAEPNPAATYEKSKLVNIVASTLDKVVSETETQALWPTLKTMLEHLEPDSVNAVIEAVSEKSRNRINEITAKTSHTERTR
jgi:hypothetical protein